MAKQLQWHNTLALMDIELIHKLSKDNVMLDVLNHKKEYQREMPWESIQILWIMFIEESDLEIKIQETYVKDYLAQIYFNDLNQKQKMRKSPF